MQQMQFQQQPSNPHNPHDLEMIGNTNLLEKIFNRYTDSGDTCDIFVCHLYLCGCELYRLQSDSVPCAEPEYA